MASGVSSHLGPKPAVLSGDGGPSLHRQYHWWRCCEDKGGGAGSPQAAPALRQLSVVPASSLRRRGPSSLSLVPFCCFWYGVWVAQRTSRAPLQGLSIQPLLLLVALYCQPYKSWGTPFPVLRASLLLCSGSPGHFTTHTPLCPQSLLFVDPAASSVMRFLSSTADICLVHRVHSAVLC